MWKTTWLAAVHTHMLLLAHMGALREAGGQLMPEQERLMMWSELRTSRSLSGLCHAGGAGRSGFSPAPEDAASTVQIVQEAGIQWCKMNSIGLWHTLLQPQAIWPTGKTTVSVQSSRRFIYTICPSFFSKHKQTKKRTHPTVWCTNDMVSIFKLIVFEAGNCINQAWHLFYDSLVLRAWVTPWPREEWPLLPHVSFQPAA